MGGTEVELNIDQFIKAIHTRSVLWNTKNRNYTTEYKRNQAWKEICIALDKNFHDLSPKQQKRFDSTVRQKFETLKDSYQREKYCLNYEDMVGGRNFKRKIFIHYDKLHFLNASITDNEDVQPTEAKRSSPQPTENSPPSKKVRNTVKELGKQNKAIEPKTSEIRNKQNHIPAPLTSPASDQSQNEEDTLFLLSLVTEIKKIPEDNRLSARIDILQTIRRWQTNHSQQICSLSPIRGVPLNDTTLAKEKDSPKLNKIFLCDMCCLRCTTREELKSHKMLHKKYRYGKFAKKNVVKDISMDVTLDCDQLEIELKEESCDSNDSLIM